MTPRERYVLPGQVSCACPTRPIMKQRQKIVPKVAGYVSWGAARPV